MRDYMMALPTQSRICRRSCLTSLICFLTSRRSCSLQNGVDIKTVSAMLGHYDAGFTLRTYTHTTRQKQDEAAQTMGNLIAQVR